jgi:Ca2+-transporting ATPase
VTAATGLRTGGLTSARARELLREHGPNEPPAVPTPGIVARVATQLRDPMIVLLLVAGVVTAALHDLSDAVIIAVVVVFNTVVGVAQQVRADRAMLAVRALAAPWATVVRDGEVADVPAREVVPGDVLDLVGGTLVAADARVIDGPGVEVDESAVTGESVPVPRGSGEELLAGTVVVRGRARAVVVLTGRHSSLGRLAAEMAAGRTPATPLQRRLGRLSRWLVLAVVTATVAVVAIGLAQGRPALEMVVVGVSLAVAAVPESLPAVVTIALALGARRMARRNAVVRNLPAVETLGSVTVVATDKTGTLTEGRLTPRVLWTERSGELTIDGPSFRPWASADHAARLLRDVAMCNDASVTDLVGEPRRSVDPLDLALLRLAADAGALPGEEWERIAERPFDALVRRMTTVHRHPDGRVVTACKGAPETVLDLVGSGTVLDVARTAAGELAASGWRVLAVADRTEHDPGPLPEVVGHAQETGLELVGLVAVGDSPRAATPEVVAACHRAGVRLLLVTGDHPATAEAIARQVGISPETDARVDGRGPVFARVRPEEKVALVERLQASGEVVAMLGDGVNDGPALRRADIGVAAGKGGTEVARQAADLVLMDDDLSTVVAAIEEGRRVLANVRSFLVFALSGGLAEVGVMLLGPLFGIPLPLVAAQILWINLVTHGLTGVAFGAQPADPAQMTQPPSRIAALLSREALHLIALVATALTGTGLAVGLGTAPEHRTTTIFLALGLGQLGVGWVVGRRRASGGRGGLLGAMLVLSAALMAVAVAAPPLQALLHTTVPAAHEVAVAVVASLLPGAVALLVPQVRRDVRD